jgi:NAD(P)-dependent dehydrogenase (short-subunit alcohol dehydrogenase family)
LGLLQEKVAIVTGAGQGIGRGIARRFAREGARVVIAEIDERSGRQVEQELLDLGAEAIFVQTDVSKKEQVEHLVRSAVERFGRLDILVNNAIKAPAQVLMEDKTDAMLAEQLAIGVWGTWWCMHAAMPIMRRQGGGRIINFTSIDVDSGAWLHADYSVAKAGIQAMTRSAAMDWGRYNILVNCVAPTAITAPFEEMCAKRPELKEAAAKSRPIGRLGDPEEDIAPVVVMLASDGARYVTGATVPVDGGKHLPRGMNRPDQLL